MELAPTDFDIRRDLGRILARQGKFSEAISQLNEVLRLNPDSAEAHNDLGVVLQMAGQPEGSLAHFSTALRLKPTLTVARDNLRRAQSEIDARQK
jgi:Flp pilus assembly protein TadD